MALTLQEILERKKFRLKMLEDSLLLANENEKTVIKDLINKIKIEINGVN